MKTVGKLSYDPKKIIGDGRNSFVFSGFYETAGILESAADADKNKKQVAIKRIQKESFLENDDISLNHEVDLMLKVGHHPNILHYIHSEMDEHFLYIATELCIGTLDYFFNGKYDGLKKKIIDEREILRQVTQGLSHLHSLRIVHRDIKPTNILIFVPSEEAKSKPQMKLASFDISKILKTDKNDVPNTSMTNPKGTRGWMPPELFKGLERIDLFKVDVWALGCIFAYILCEGKHPFGEDVITRIDLIRKEKDMLMKKRDMKNSYFFDSQAFAVIKSMLRTDPSKRPTVEGVLKHPFFIPDGDRKQYYKQLWKTMRDQKVQLQARTKSTLLHQKTCYSLRTPNKTIGLELCYHTKDIVGFGGFGTIVYGGFYKSSPVAIKRMQWFDNDKSAVQLQEVELMRKAKHHANILCIIHTEKNDDFLFIVTELCRGTLDDYVKETYNYEPRFESEEEILSQITRGLAHLHKEEIVHRDIKPNNILIFVPDGSGTKPVVKLADFGISKMLKANKNYFTNTSVTNPSGSRGWMPPEVYKEERLDFKIDVWALGCIFAYTLCGGKHPFGEDVDKRINLIREENVMLMVQTDMKGHHQWDPQAFPLIKSMLRTDPSKRPTVEEILKHPFFIDKEDRMEYFGQLWSSLKDSLTSDQKDQLKEMLLGNGIWEIDIDHEMEFDHTPLHILCNYYNNENLIDWVILLLEKGADVTAETKNGQTPLHLLCSNYEKDNMKTIVQLLIDKGADVKAQNEDGSTPLQYLCQNGFESNQIFNRKDIFQLLVENDADVNAADQDETTSLHLLFMNDKKNNDLVDIVCLLREKDADAMAKNIFGDTPLHSLCRNKKNNNMIDVIKLLTDESKYGAGADVNAQNDRGENPLHVLCSNYQSDDFKDILKFLIKERSANVNAKSNDGSTPLHYLCFHNKKDNMMNAIQALIHEGAQVNAKDDDDKTSLHYLCENYGNNTFIGSVQLLIEENADVNAPDKKGLTPLHYLCKNRYKNDNLIAVFQLFIQKNVDVNVKDKDGNTPLHVLCEYYEHDNLINIVQLLVQNGAEVNAIGKYGKTPLHSLCEKCKCDNLIDIVQFFLKSGSEVNAKDEDENTPLYSLCCYYRNDNLIDIAKLLVDNGAEVNAKEKDGKIPLHSLLGNKYKNDNLIEIVQFFLNNNSEVNAKDKDGRTPLHFFCKPTSWPKNYKFNPVFQLLLQNNVDVNAKDKDGNIPLHVLCEYYEHDNLINIVQLLVYNGAEINTKNNNESTPLHVLCENYENANLIEILQFFLENGSEVNAKDEDGNTPLHWLCKEYRNDNLINIVQFLVDNGAEVNVRDNHGNTPLHKVLSNYGKLSEGIVQLLLKRDEDVTTVNTDGWTPLHSLCSNDRKDKIKPIVQLLISKDAKVKNAQDNDGNTPLHILCRYYHIGPNGNDLMNLRSIVILFEKYGASMGAKNNQGKTPNDFLTRLNIPINMLAMEPTNRVAIEVLKDPFTKDENTTECPTNAAESTEPFPAQEPLAGPSSAHDGEFIRPGTSRKRKRINYSIPNVHQNSNTVPPVPNQLEPAVLPSMVSETPSNPQLNQEPMTD